MLKHFNLGDIKFRTFQNTDSVTEINSLLLAAYQPLADAGMRYAASWEDAEATQRHIQDGECHLGFLESKIISCAILRSPLRITNPDWRIKSPSWYHSANVATFGRFAVLPELKGKGLGSKVMDILEARTKELGFTELALDTSEHASHLIQMYEKRDYRFIQFHKWNSTNYRSVVLSKVL